MSYFLQNLVDRHKHGDAGLEAGYKVQPRPKARFEADSGVDFFAPDTLVNRFEYSAHTGFDSDPGSDLTRDYPNTGSLLTGDLPHPPQQTHDAVQQRNDNPQNQSDYRSGIDALNARTEAATAMPGQQSYTRETPHCADNSQDINQRIHTILQHLNSLQAQQTKQGAYAVRHDSIIADGGNKKPVDTKPLPIMTEPTVGLVQAAVKLKTPGIEGRSEPREGVLQIPTWLADMQADLNNRRQAMNADLKSEPVVNVTIGRIEVRAAQTDSASRPKIRNKPSGVMSLDDYLKHRENRGRG